MQTIEIDFDVFKELTVRRSSESVSYNDVLRKLLNLEEKKSLAHDGKNKENGWETKGIFFPDGTEFRCYYKGKHRYAEVRDGQLYIDSKAFTSPSAAAVYITKTSVNGWKFWECKKPNESVWHLIDYHRKHR